MKQTTGTIAAIATYPAGSAIGIIRLSGPDAFEISSKVFFPKNNKDFSSIPHSSAALGTITGPGGPIDEAVALVFKAPRSYTGEDLVEFSCHGNPLILSSVLSLLIKNGACQAGPGDFTRRAFLNGKMDLTQAEAVTDVINAEGEAALKISLNQLFGREKDTVEALKLEIIKVFSLIEAGLDFEQEGAETGAAAVKTAIKKTAEKVSLLIESADKGILLKEGVKAVITGRPNAGKSSILNAVSGMDRAIVTHIPGTTRDTIEAAVMIEGIRFKFIDTAGIRSSSDPVEAEGIKRARKAVDECDIAILALDSSSPLTGEDLKLYSEIAAKPAVIALNKCDMPAMVTPESARKVLNAGLTPVVSVSAKTGFGINDLTNRVKSIIIGSRGLDAPGEVMVSSMRHKAALEKSGMELNAALKAMDGKAGLEIVSEHVKSAAYYAGSIIGEVATDDILDSIFSNFCVGK